MKTYYIMQDRLGLSFRYFQALIFQYLGMIVSSTLISDAPVEYNLSINIFMRE